ncbi:MAG TPA: HRDC domain-containing protein [Accumulibacter sp.]|nr:HRDC domain-containing protein [Accumulibacter sp.]
MTPRFFVVRAFSPAEAEAESEAESNQVLAEGCVLAGQRPFVGAGESSFWAICVSLAPAPGRLPEAVKAGGVRRVDDREVLDEADFAVYARLRKPRKLRKLRQEIAEGEGVALFTVFINEQLATMVQQRVNTREAMAAIDGVGSARLERYAPRFLALRQQVWPANAGGAA